MDYQLNPDAAKQADQVMGRIDTTGKYIGRFTRAENVTSNRGTKGVEFSFKSDDGQNADYLTLWTVNPEGTELFGHKILMAIMTCLKVKAIKQESRQIEKYDADAGQRIKTLADVFPALMDKPIGLLLRKEEYEANDGAVKSKMAIVAAFEAATGFTASEILGGATKAETLAKMEATLRDKLLKPAAAAPAATSGNGAAKDGDFDDDIPF